MADKQISQLVAATTLNNEDLLVIQQGQIAKKLSGERLAMFVYLAAGSMIDEVNSAVEEAQAAVDELLEEKNAIAQTIADMAGLGTDTTLTTPGMAADAKEVGDRIADVEKDALAGLNQKTISDVAIASFDDGADNAPVKELIVNIDPVQDLHGQDAPYPAGGGKNKFDKEYYSDASNYTINYSSYYYSKLLLKPNTSYVFNPTSTSKLSTSRYYVLLIISGDDVDDPTDSRIVYPVSAGTPVQVKFTTGETGAIWFGIFSGETASLTAFMSVDWQLEEGATATPWSPFANICPITGWTGCEANVTSANLFDKDNPLVINAYLDNGKIISNSSHRTIYIPCKPNTAYTAQKIAVNTNDRFYIAYCNEFPANNVSIYGLTGKGVNFVVGEKYSYSVTTGADAKYIVVWVSTASDYNDSISTTMIEVGETASTYKPYSGATLSVAFPSEAGTVYGAKLNFTTGKLIVDTAARQFDGSGDVYSFVSNGRVNIDFAGIDYKKGLDKDSGISNSYAGLMQTANNANFDSSAINYASCYNISSSANNFTVRIKDSRFVDLNTAQGILEEEPLVIIFNLNTPIVYNLTPIEVRTLLKINNIWANTGNINTLIYRTIPITEEVIREIMGDYEEIIAGVESTGKATKNYYAGNLVIVDDILYKCLVNVASGETFTPGAGGNVSQTTIADELATLQALYDNLGNLALLSYTTA